ncbi:hypothetical protein JMUB6875_02140 [Nocardia sp. JMUB6875]|uniref:FAD-binding oxidoreductase n=1 Tax=Nocardia sp. JMUB6875 TaxID=3158170 RepID=UPI0032E7DF25
MHDLSDLRTAVRGRVTLAGDDGFDAARQPWNRAVDQRAAAVVEVADAWDAAALVAFARDRGLTVSAQPSGHGATGDVDGVILVRTAALTGMRIDPESWSVRVWAGTQWGEVCTGAQDYDLLPVTGSSPVVSVVGYTLGGGLSWFARRFGWAADHVTAFDVITADAMPARVTAATDPDLFWALRGGGGDFALVTAMEFDLQPAPALFGGRMLWTGDKIADALAVFREITSDAPEELTVWLTLLQLPGAPAPMVAIDHTYLGSAAAARELMSPAERLGPPIFDGRGPPARR